MSFMSGRKTWVIVGILVLIGGGAAFVFFDPLNLDLLGMKPNKVVAQPAAKPGAAPAAKAGAAAAPAAQPSAAPKAAAATPAATTPAPAVAPAQLKLTQTIKTEKSSPSASKPANNKPTSNKPERAKNLDLRHCLDMESDAEIAKCAGE